MERTEELHGPSKDFMEPLRLQFWMLPREEILQMHDDPVAHTTKKGF
jgi:hypothetical protein